MPKNEHPRDHLEQIKADIISDNVCPDLAQGATQLVMGHGSPSARIVFIGEAPGKNEDLQGIPFVGAAGKLLNEMMEANGIPRTEMYITNIVKYRPPNNRDPLPEEKKAFWPYLLRELKVIQPQAIVTLGRHSMEFFLPDKKISAVHGKVFTVAMSVAGAHGESSLQGAREQRTEAYKKYADGVAESATQQGDSNKTGISSYAREQSFVTMKLLPLYHPAAALYNGQLKQTLFDDFKNVVNFIN